MRTFERRVIPADSCKVIRASDKTGEIQFRGQPWVYGQQSEDLGGWAEIIEPGAASRTLAKDPDVRFLINHDSNLLLARTASGTLTLTEDDSGGIADAHLANVSYARDLAELIDRGDMTQMSFGFWVTSDSWAGNLHQVREFDLDGGDVSAVTFPAYPQTSVELRAAAKRHAQGAVDVPDVEVTPEALRRFLESLPDVEADVLSEAFEQRAGKVLSASNEEIVRKALDALQTLLDKTTKEEQSVRSLGLDLLRLRQMEAGLPLSDLATH